MAYVDGFVCAVPKDKRETYIEVATKAAEVFREFGATRVVECWEDDVADGKVTDFRRAVKAESNEAVVFSWIEYPTKEIRDAAVAKMRTDERMRAMEMPFDGKRMIFGGFAPVLDQKA